MGIVAGTAFINIDSTRVAVNSPVSTDLMTDIVSDLNFLESGAQHGIQVFIGAGSYNFTTGPNTYAVKAKVLGAGGGAAGGTAGVGVGGGGGAGAYQESWMNVTPNTIYTVVVGSGGAGASGASAYATAGTASSFNGLVAGGGVNGARIADGSAGGAGATATVSSFIIGVTGQNGWSGLYTGTPGIGGHSHLGFATGPGDGGGYGAGGSANVVGGPGGGGMVIIEL